MFMTKRRGEYMKIIFLKYCVIIIVDSVCMSKRGECVPVPNKQ